MTEYSGLWTCRIFNPTYVTGDQTPQKELDLILADAVFDFQTPTSTTLQGIIGWPGGGLDLNGTVQPGVGGEPASFDIVGTGRTGTNSAGKEYLYQGHRARSWTNAVDQRPALVGSFFSRAKPNRAIEEPIPLPEELMGTGYPFIAVKQQI